MHVENGFECFIAEIGISSPAAAFLLASLPSIAIYSHLDSEPPASFLSVIRCSVLNLNWGTFFYLFNLRKLVTSRCDFIVHGVITMVFSFIASLSKNADCVLLLVSLLVLWYVENSDGYGLPLNFASDFAHSVPIWVLDLNFAGLRV